MAIIIAIIAAVIVIAALITFNVRNASPGPEKQEATDRIAPPEEEKNEAQYPAEARAAEHTPSVVENDSQKEKRNTMGDDIYRQALQKFKHSDEDQAEEEVTEESDKMQDRSYRDALLSMKNKKK
ncbi:hypothetical protein SC22_16620 [Bacillus sp. A053]|uniref:hypothetical protein n=1 Tax=Bacillus TaxID=1386 RepID=UPI000589BB08|nr:MULTISPECIES: hypothetical protein [Bacillus]ASB60190.1 hypothetical protein CDO84_04040 [Bacillus sp. MD-5]KIH40270.1 hypothetical protein SC22_16620 [Bacillus sp. A053]MDL9995140.1 hypothetical protein [Bacillus stercoris]